LRGEGDIMDNVMTQVIRQYFELTGIPAEQVDENVIRVRARAGEALVEVYIFVDEQTRDVQFNAMNFLPVPEERFTVMFAAVNQANRYYKHVKFMVDTEHRQITARDDDILQLDTAGQESRRLLNVLLDVIEDAFPNLVKALEE